MWILMEGERIFLHVYVQLGSCVHSDSKNGKGNWKWSTNELCMHVYVYVCQRCFFIISPPPLQAAHWPSTGTGSRRPHSACQVDVIPWRRQYHRLSRDDLMARHSFSIAKYWVFPGQQLSTKEDNWLFFSCISLNEDCPSSCRGSIHLHQEVLRKLWTLQDQTRTHLFF